MPARLLMTVPLLLVLGCGGPKVARVKGKIMLDGHPLAEAHVNFQPIGEGQLNPGQGSHGKTDANGVYELEFIGGGMGALVGKHSVQISKIVGQAPPPDKDPQRALPELVPAKYNRQTTLTCDVPPGGREDANFDLKK